MGLWRSLDGLVTAELTSAALTQAVKAVSEHNIEIFHLEQKDDLTAVFQLRRRDVPTLRKLTDRRHETLRILEKSGLYWTGRTLLKRKLLLFGMSLIFFLALFLPTRVLFVRVEGNEGVPARLILEKAGECGISFGASRREVRSERTKNALLSLIPELQWAGVNTSGCTAVISVRERTDDGQKEENHGVSRIVASRDGVVTSVTVTSGNGLCVPGQAVKAGQTLVSGFTDCGLSIRASRAQGEIFASTRWDLEVLSPSKAEAKSKKLGTTKKYAVVIGKKRINFYKDSGISGTSCDKMYKEIYVTLPGGFRLPVKLVMEEWTEWETSAGTVDPDEALLSEFAGSYLRGQMVAGTIRGREEAFEQTEAVCRLQGHYDCLEMIGRERSEEIIHGKTD